MRVWLLPLPLLRLRLKSLAKKKLGLRAKVLAARWAARVKSPFPVALGRGQLRCPQHKAVDSPAKGPGAGVAHNRTRSPIPD